jgi:hypothetical protein
MRVDTVGAGVEPRTRVTASLRASGKEGPEGETPTHAVMLSFDCFGENTTVAIMTDQALRQGVPTSGWAWTAPLPARSRDSPARPAREERCC